MHSVSGSVNALSDGHPISHATVRLLYADDREPARETELVEDGAFTFEYVPEGKYILAVTDAKDEAPKTVTPGQPDAANAPTKPEPTYSGPTYSDKEMPITVLNDTEGINLTLAASTPSNAVPPVNPGQQ
jgi:hypothetical protein